jgi:LAO/AO transport system kinase
MENLSRSEDCFIRPSPSGRKAGGVSEGTRDVLRLCELLDFDILLVETVGVGQNELDVCSMVDLTILLFPPFGGDELQG